ADVDLSTVKGLETIRHLGPSTIGLDTFYRTGKPLPNTFLWGCGVPPEITIPLPVNPAQAASYFITYANAADAVFATRLYETLQQRGVRCWLDAKPSPLGITAARLSDRVLLCASRTSLHSDWIDAEINNALSKEETLSEQRGQRAWALIPLDVDGYLHSAQFRSPHKTQLLSRLKANFTGWERDNLLFLSQLSQLLIALGLENAADITPSQPTQPNQGGWKLA
ncbi:MAG: toll/interleukin-1 receptor domain-containing protein, partial [Anaerolineae bacterium]|nr:toll/interleukin-1 receptor domain-containing protein [Anaerolineae bacterium]